MKQHLNVTYKESTDAAATTASYAVGFAKPPIANRFQPGQSGNPKGRPRGAKNKLEKLGVGRFKTIILAEAYRSIALRDGDKNVTVPIAQAVMRSMAANAVKGNPRAQRHFVELLDTIERESFTALREWNNKRLDYKFDWERELERRRKEGVVLPDPFPHPDTYVIDPTSGLVKIYGPRNRDEIPLYLDGLAEGIKELEDATQLLREIPLEEHEREDRRKFLKTIFECERTLKTLRAIESYGEEGGEGS